MSTKLPRVCTIAPGGNFLHVLADAVLSGFPFEGPGPKPPLAEWTILLPTRRAAREFNVLLAKRAGPTTILLPRVKPIGDVDEDLVLEDQMAGDLPNAISDTALLFTLLNLLHQWADDNPHIALAREIASSTVQSLGLANSLMELLEQAEIEEIQFNDLEAIYEIEISEHRNSILSLLSLLQISLPRILAERNMLSKAARRNRLIRHEASRINEGKLKGPIIAAGSTGTMPATRALLNAIALAPHGAVVLPGLDQLMDEESWAEITPEHPQFALRNLLTELEIKRSDVVELNPSSSKRLKLISEMMRPTATTDNWRSALMGHVKDLTKATEDLKLIEAPDRHIEARSIALILRQALEKKDQTAALVTPDRDLAIRVKAELLRWNINIDDSAGEPLVDHGLASLADCLINTVMSNFDAPSLLALLYHSECNPVGDREFHLNCVRNFEIAVLRNYGAWSGLEGIKQAYERAVLARKSEERVHPLVAKLDDKDWDAMSKFLRNVYAALDKLCNSTPVQFSAHAAEFLICLKLLAPNADLLRPENQTFMGLVDEWNSSNNNGAALTLSSAMILISHLLRHETLRLPHSGHPRLAIYGLLEARLMAADVMVLGGLNEARWPKQPDSGPWLNRTMRQKMGLPLPERNIGLEAHDFIQCLGHAQVFLTAAQRIEGAPQMPSRWIWRLQIVLQLSNIVITPLLGKSWTVLAQSMDETIQLQCCEKPAPRPMLDARPVQFSVTEVEKLIRDPYGIYAKKILKLEPLPNLARAADAALRGTLFHAAINKWNVLQSAGVTADSLKKLIAAGHEVFAPFAHDQEVSSFWWPRFVRMANWLAALEPKLRVDLAQIHAEVGGRLEFDIDGVTHVLSARADRIDILQDGHARIIDYKTGTVPSADQVNSGMSPQLPLEGAILAHGNFGKLAKIQASSFEYIWIGGTAKPGEHKPHKLAKAETAAELAERHLQGFKNLLAQYRDQNQVYLPRVAPQKEEGELDYDHLSRFREWMLSGGRL